MNYSFEETAGASQSTVRKLFDGNAIYDVTFDGCEARDIQGVQDTTKVFHVLDIKFSNDDIDCIKFYFRTWSTCNSYLL